MNPLAYLRVAEMLGALALLASICFGVHEFLEHEQGIGEARVQARWDTQKAADKLAAEKQAQDWRDTYNTAIQQGAINAQIARAAATAANAASDSLRNTSADLVKQLPLATAETARAYAAAYSSVFDKCVGRYKAMGETAQGHADDAKSLSDAWPQ